MLPISGAQHFQPGILPLVCFCFPVRAVCQWLKHVDGEKSRPARTPAKRPPDPPESPRGGPEEHGPTPGEGHLTKRPQRWQHPPVPCSPRHQTKCTQSTGAGCHLGCTRMPVGPSGCAHVFAFGGGNPPLGDGWAGGPPAGVGVKRAGSKNCQRWAASSATPG